VYTKQMEVYGQMVSPQGPTMSEGKSIKNQQSLFSLWITL